jgi:hypothetical protein
MLIDTITEMRVGAIHQVPSPAGIFHLYIQTYPADSLTIFMMTVQVGLQILGQLAISTVCPPFQVMQQSAEAKPLLGPPGNIVHTAENT